MLTSTLIRVLRAALVAATMSAASSAIAAGIRVEGGVFQIHDSITAANRVGGETAPVLTSWDWNGGFIATWLNYRSASDRRSFAGFYSLSGFQIYPGPRQLGGAGGLTSGIPSLSAAPVSFGDGTSLALFSSDRRGAPAASKRDIFGQRFTSGSISPVGTPLGINTALANAQDTLFTTRLSNGNALVAFVSHATAASTFDIKGRVVNKNAAGVTSEKPLTVGTAGAQTPTSLASLSAAGRSVLAYVVKTGSTQAFRLQRLDAVANRIGGPVLVKSVNGAASYGGVGVAGLSGGRYIAAWFTPGSGGAATLRARIFSATGVAGPVLTIGSTRIQNTAATPPKVAVDTDGRIGIVTGGFNGQNFAVQAWVLSPAGARLAGPFNLRTAGRNTRLTPESLVPLRYGGFVTSWTENAAQLTAAKAMGVRFRYVTDCGRC